MSKDLRTTWGAAAWPLLGTVLLTAVLLGACAAPGDRGDTAAQGTPKIVTTTGIVADAARRVVGDRATVVALMAPGVDPHLYKASESDVRRLDEADLILYNGLHLEGKMGDILVKLARSRPVVAVTEAVSQDRLREPPEFLGQFDPHVWFDVDLWSATLEPIAAAAAEIAPQHAEEFRANADAYRRELLELDAWIQQRVEEIPAEFRVMVTAHDAFGYFGERYGMEVVGLQGISTLSEAGLQDVDRVVDLVVERQIKAIFVESSVPRRSIEAVQAACQDRGHEVVIGEELFSDAMGAEGTPEGTYPGMVRHNVNAVVEALR